MATFKWLGGGDDVCYQFLRTDVREPHPLKKIDENAGWLIAALTMSPLFLTLAITAVNLTNS